jgi:hypothetical protein
VGQQKLPFDDKDPIFQASAAKKALDAEEFCHSCKAKCEEKERVHCKFCGHSNCKNCCQKKRNFPRANLGADGKISRGEICLLCDRKFLVRANFIQDKAQFQKKVVKDKALLTELDELEREIQELNLKRNLRSWKHMALKRSESCSIEVLKTLNQVMHEDIKKYQEMLKTKGDSAVNDKILKEQ